MPPPQKSPANTKLMLTTNSVRNTTISNSSDTIYYEVRTEPWTPLNTKIKWLDPATRQYEVRGEIRKSSLGEEVLLRSSGKEWMRSGEFLRMDGTGKWGGTRPTSARFFGEDGREYRWNVKGRRLELFRADTSTAETSMARYHRHARHLFVLRMSRHACLEVNPDLHDILDSVILSYILFERARRHPEERKEISAVV